MDEVFNQIYQRGGWDAQESVSGHGSDFGETASLRAALPTLLQRLNVHSLLDIPCGDCNWMQHLAYPLDYIGMDVVVNLIAANTARYPERRFVVGNIVTDHLPKVDMILCRDCLVHLPLHDGLQAIQHIIESGSTYLAITSHLLAETNTDIAKGQWRALNMQLPPFKFPKPLDQIVELEGDAPAFGKTLGIWRINDLTLQETG